MKDIMIQVMKKEVENKMEEFKEIEVDKIKTLQNIRTRVREKDLHELMDNIKQQGLLQPIGVWKTKKAEYIIAYGNRRLDAVRRLGWKTITCKILGELSIEDLLILNASENIHRKETNLAELGRICNILEDKGLTLSEIAIRLSQPLSKIRMATKIFEKIPAEHRKDIVFMTPGTKAGFREGKIPANVFNVILQMERGYSLDRTNINDLIRAVKTKHLTYSQMMIISVFLRDGMNLKTAIVNLDSYHIRRVNIPVNKKVEAELMEKHNVKTVYELFIKIMSGKITPPADLVYYTERTI